MTITEMLEKRKTAVDSAIKFAESHRTERGTLTDEDYGTYQTMEKEIADMNREISRMQREEDMKNELSKPVNMPIVSKPTKADDEGVKSFRATNEYKSAMIGALRSNFRNVSNVLQEGVDANVINLRH